MYFQILLNYIMGYITIEIEGYFIERFINICNSKNIFLWNIKKINSTIIRVNIGIHNFKKLKTISKKTKCKIKIKKKRGFPFILKKYKKRKIFFLFFIVIIITTIILSNFIWNIEITGNQKIDSKEMLDVLEKNNLKLGTSKIGINTKQIIEQIRLEREDIAWIGIEIKGTNAIVKIVEADLKPDIIKQNEYCNIIAIKDGIIVKVNAQNRNSRSKRGRCNY